MSKQMNVTLRGLRRLQAIMKRRAKEAKPCPDICLVLPHNYGFRPGDRFEARMSKGKLVVANKSKLSAKERRELKFSGTYSATVENANWSSRLLPCPFCGSRARLHPDVPEQKIGNFGHFEIRCSGCGVRTEDFKFKTAEETVAAWNWRVQLQPASEKGVEVKIARAAEKAKVAKVKKPKTSRGKRSDEML